MRLRRNKLRRNLDNVINWLILAEVLVGVIIAIAIVMASRPSAEPHDEGTVVQLKTLEDSIHYFEDGY